MRLRTGSIAAATTAMVMASLLLVLAYAHGNASPALQSLPDLTVYGVDRSDLVGDWQRNVVSGTVAVTITNVSAADALTRFDVIAFEDTDADGAFGSADIRLGRESVDSLPSGQRERLVISVSGSVLFRHNLVHVVVDAFGRIAESDETNNVTDSGLSCRHQTQPGPPFSPELEWQWTGSPVAPAANQVIGAPVVIDLDGDSRPEIAFVSFPPDAHDASAHADDGILRVVRGDGSGEVFSVTDPNLQLRPNIGLAAGDIDGDGTPELIGVHESSTRLVAFSHTGALEWLSDPMHRLHMGGAAIANIDHQGNPEIVVGATVLNYDGTIRWSIPVTAPFGTGRALHNYPVVADLDPHGDLEVVCGNTAFRADGTVYWHNPMLTDGTNAVANFDQDRSPEIVLVTEGSVYLLEHDGSIKWGPTTLPGGTTRNFGGPPTVADFDGDGEPEIGVAGGYAYTVIDTQGSVLWSMPTRDITSHRTASSAVDFEGDGRTEVVYGDETTLWVFAGNDGTVRWQRPSSSSTQSEMPVVADVDGDGSVEIVKVTNDFHAGQDHGVQVFGDTLERMLSTRSVWNQHTYHISNVGEGGGIPTFEIPSWQLFNSYRANWTVPTSPLAPDLTASRLAVNRPRPQSPIWVGARFGNGGAATVPAGVTVSFYDGPPGPSAQLIASSSLPDPLAPGDWLDLAVVWPNHRPGPWTIYVAIDDDGTGQGTVDECDESNNIHWWTFDEPVAPTPTATPSPQTTWVPTETVTPSAPATSSPQPTPNRSACICAVVRRGVPPAVVNDAIANPDHYFGWGVPLDPNKPSSPLNPPRTCLSLQHSNLRYHPLWNAPVWRVGCP